MLGFASKFFTDTVSHRSIPLDDSLYNVQVFKRAICFNLVGGIQLLNKGRMAVDFYAGAGARYQKTEFGSTPAGKEHVLDAVHGIPIDAIRNKEEEGFFFNLVLGLKIGYRLFR
jgi:hypothetical protein